MRVATPAFLAEALGACTTSGARDESTVYRIEISDDSSGVLATGDLELTRGAALCRLNFREGRRDWPRCWLASCREVKVTSRSGAMSGKRP